MARRNGDKVTDTFGNVTVKNPLTLLALYKDPVLKEEIVVQVPDTPWLGKAQRYMASTDDQDCYYSLDGQTKLLYHPGQTSRGGSSGIGFGGYVAPAPAKGPRPQLENPAPRAPRREFEGYRFLINTAKFSTAFNQRAGVYDVNEGGMITASDQKLVKDVQVENARDIMRVLAEGKEDWLANSEIVFRNEALQFSQFFIPKGAQSRLVDLVHRLETRQPGAKAPLVMAELTTTMRHDPTPDWNTKDRKLRGKVPRAPINKILIGTDEEGRRISVRFDVYIDEQRGSNTARDALSEAGTYYMMGDIRHKKQAYKDEIIYYLNLKVINADQIVNVNIENIEAQMKTDLEAHQRVSEYGPQRPRDASEFLGHYEA